MHAACRGKLGSSGGDAAEGRRQQGFLLLTRSRFAARRRGAAAAFVGANSARHAKGRTRIAASSACAAHGMLRLAASLRRRVAPPSGCALTVHRRPSDLFSRTLPFITSPRITCSCRTVIMRSASGAPCAIIVLWLVTKEKENSNGIFIVYLTLAFSAQDGRREGLSAREEEDWPTALRPMPPSSQPCCHGTFIILIGMLRVASLTIRLFMSALPFLVVSSLEGVVCSAFFQRGDRLRRTSDIGRVWRTAWYRARAQRRGGYRRQTSASGVRQNNGASSLVRASAALGKLRVCSKSSRHDNRGGARTQ